MGQKRPADGSNDGDQESGANHGGNKIGLSLSRVSRKGITILRSGRRRRPMAEPPTQNRENNPMQTRMGLPARAPASIAEDMHTPKKNAAFPRESGVLFDHDT